MSQYHLSDLRQALESNRWVVSKELEGNDYDISGTWVVERSDGSCSIHIDFQGLDDLETLPMEKAFACKVREQPGIGAYFARKNRTWPDELESFIQSLQDWAS